MRPNKNARVISICPPAELINCFRINDDAFMIFKYKFTLNWFRQPRQMFFETQLLKRMV